MVGCGGRQRGGRGAVEGGKAARGGKGARRRGGSVGIGGCEGVDARGSRRVADGTRVGRRGEQWGLFR